MHTRSAEEAKNASNPAAAWASATWANTPNQPSPNGAWQAEKPAKKSTYDSNATPVKKCTSSPEAGSEQRRSNSNENTKRNHKQIHQTPLPKMQKRTNRVRQSINSRRLPCLRQRNRSTNRRQNPRQGTSIGSSRISSHETFLNRHLWQ